MSTERDRHSEKWMRMRSGTKRRKRDNVLMSRPPESRAVKVKRPNSQSSTGSVSYQLKTAPPTGVMAAGPETAQV